MKHNTKQLIQSTLAQDDSFSSHTHHLADDAHPLPQEYSIPASYGVDTVCLMGVNVDTVHTYWEVTPNLLAQHGLEADAKLTVALKNSEGKILYDFTTQKKQDKQYIKIHPQKQSLFVQIGSYRDGKFLLLLQSNSFVSFNTQIIYPKESDMKWLSISGGYKEVIYSTMMHYTFGLSSKQYAKQIDSLEKFSNLDIEQISSATLHKDKK
ncbi:MAG: DUF4912 domain-containing protein [Campylobacterota bacterium]